MTCLVRSLALRWMLNKRGIPVQLCIGVSKILFGMHAHAWVEINGQPIGDAQDVAERFKKLTEARYSQAFPFQMSEVSKHK